MENCNDLDLISCDFIEHSKRKSVHYTASQISMNNWKQEGITDNSCEHVVDTLHELQV